jgi:hypothetical protein
MAMRVHRQLLVTLFAAAALAGAGCGANEAPLFPTYTNNVKPILEAHCIRCHGAGGMLNTDPDIGQVSGVTKPKTTDFTTYQGVLSSVSIGLFIPSIMSLPMPPPPSTALDSYDYDTLANWVKNGAPQ